MGTRPSVRLSSMSFPSRSRFLALVAALGLAASACGSGSTSPTTAAAQENIDELATNDDVRLVEVLDVVSGGVTTLAEAVDGDRPVLLWFWAPH